MAIDDLHRIPRTIGTVAGGIENLATVKPISWSRGPIYSASDFPELPKRFTALLPSPTQLEHENELLMAGLGQPGNCDKEEMILYSRKALLEICWGLDPEAILPELRQIIYRRQPSGEVPF